ncbi:MAG: YbaB/EbfC family nucleoid-associated protein [Bdellovibrionales bacterium]
MKGFGGGGMQNLMRQANQMQARMKKVQEELNAREFEGSSGGGAVKVIAFGSNQLKLVEIQPDVISSGDKDMLQDLILTAVNDALRLAKTTSDAELGKITGGFSMPGM